MNTQITIERVGLMGQGIGYDEKGNIYFVPGALPGDEVEVEVEEGAKKYRDARMRLLVKPSPHRVSSPCPNFGCCGGCDWLDLEYSEQVKHKSLILQHVCERSGFEPKEFLPFLASDKTLGYRSRIQLKSSKGQLGFYKRRSHDLVPVDSCAVAEPLLNEEMGRLKAEGSSRKFRSVELVLEENGQVSRSYDSPHGSLGFTQVNRAQNEKLKKVVADRVARAGAERVLELFCGDGNLTFAYAPQVTEAVGVDSSGPAIEKAIREGAFFANVSFLRQGVGPSILRKLTPLFSGHYDTLVLDPPRAGVGGSLEFFVQPFVKNIIYISCSPLSFSQDIRALKPKGFVLEDIQGLDMFPHTRHIELVARFCRQI